MCGENQILVTELKSDLDELDSEKALEISEIYFAYCLFKNVYTRGVCDKNISNCPKSFFSKYKSS